MDWTGQDEGDYFANVDDVRTPPTKEEGQRPKKNGGQFGMNPNRGMETRKIMANQDSLQRTRMDGVKSQQGE